MQIYIDAKYVGRAMHRGRVNARIKIHDVARLFGVTPYDYKKMERGNKIIPKSMLERLMSLGFIQLHTRQFNGARELKPLTHNAQERAIFVPAD